MGVKFANNAYGTLNASIASGDTSLTLSSGQGARFPSLGAGDYFYATLIDTSNNLEIVKCTARASDVLTITRGQEGTTARAYTVGDRVELRVTAQSIVDATDVNTVVTDNSIGAAELNVSGNGSTGQYLESDGDGSFSWTSVIVTPTAISDQSNTSTGYFDLPAGTTAQRPTGATGMHRYNTTLNSYENWQSAASTDYWASTGPFVMVRFNGNTGGVFQWAGNYSSISRVTNGRYTLNFASAEPNSRYMWHIDTDTNSSRSGNHVGPGAGIASYYFSYGTSSFTFTTAEYGSVTKSDAEIIWVALWRMP